MIGIKLILVLAVAGYVSGECNMGQVGAKCTKYGDMLLKAISEKDTAKMCKVMGDQLKCYDDADCDHLMDQNTRDKFSDTCGCAYAVPSLALMTVVMVLLRLNN